MIPKSLVYRVYGGSLAIAMNVKNNRVAVLQDEALDYWQRMTDASHAGGFDQSHPVFRQLVAAGILDPPAGYSEGPPSHSIGGASAAAQEVDLGVVNYWAFKNHIPLSGHFELTAQCNLRCQHCYCVFKKRDSLSTRQVCDIVDDLQRSGTLGLVLTGGEIFFREDILEILQHLQDRKFVLRLNTNGTLIDGTVLKTLAGFSNIYRIHVSLYSPEPDIHDQIVNSKGAFQKSLNALRLLQEAGFNLRINCSVMKSNLSTYQGLAREIGDPLGIPVHYDSAIYPRDDGSVQNQEAQQISREQFGEFWKFHSARLGAAPESPKDKKLCKAGYSFFSICEDGSLYPCLKMKRFYQNPLGNLASDSFQDIWNRSEGVLRIRQAMEQKLRGCSVCDLNL
jgi:MoaA/NifB/PqqE/SkfB family radical SAM enzyme